MDSRKAKILDQILLQFSGNNSISWKSLQSGSMDMIAPYDTIETNINFLIGNGMINRIPDFEVLVLTDLGFATMTDLKNLGFVRKAKKETQETYLKYFLAIVSVITFILVLIRFAKDYF